MEAVIRHPGSNSVTGPATADFDSWVAARRPAPMRLGYVLTGNRADAEDVVQDALSQRARVEITDLTTDPFRELVAVP